jgi:tRNA threonylcarbamoyladenosine modification (KEOPS) complex  Pcc1 subunit|tara:strand:+ start:440 stop:793 length:354 start_codon:yes stop_codon:yes gene_type:complete
MSAGYHHFIIEQGATFGQTLTLKDSSDTLINLTGYTSAEMDLRETPESSSEVLTLTTANSRIALGGSAGTVTLSISAADTANLTAGDGVFDLEVVDGSSRVYRILEGTYTIRRNISR